MKYLSILLVSLFVFSGAFSQEKPKNWYSVTDFGMKNDSSADISGPLQKLINNVPAGSVIWFGQGRYRQDHADTINKKLSLLGALPQQPLQYGNLGNPAAFVTCGIYHTGQNDTAFIVTAQGTEIRNLAIINSFATQGSATSRGVYYAQGEESHFTDNSVFWFGRDYEVKCGGELVVSGNDFIDATGDYAVYLVDSCQPDDGDHLVFNNFAVQLTHNITGQFYYGSGGGIRFMYNKGNALHHATYFFNAPFAGTIIMQLQNNGSEQCNGPEFNVVLPANGTLSELEIQDNYVDGTGLGGHIVVDGSAAGALLQDYIITGNNIAMGVADTGIVLNSVKFGICDNNLFWAGKLSIATLGTVNQSNVMGFKFTDQIQNLAEVANKVSMDLGRGNVGYITLTGNDTLIIQGPKPGGPNVTIRVTQDGTGGRTLVCQGFGENWTGPASGYVNYALDTRPGKVTYITGHVNANGALTVYNVQRVFDVNAIPYVGAAPINGLTQDTGRFIYDGVNRNFKVGNGAALGNYGSTVQIFGGISLNKDSALSVLSPPASAWCIGIDTGATVKGRFIKFPIPSGGSSLSLTTTGTSGAATLIGGVLNIPQYTGGGGSSVAGGDQAIQYDSTGVQSGNLSFLAADYTNHKLSILGNTSNSTLDGLLLGTNNVATAGAPKWSNALRFRGQDWTGTTNHNVDWIIENQTATGADQGSLVFSYQVNAGTKTPMLSLTTGGFLDYNSNSQLLGLVIRSTAGGNYTNIGNETISSVVQGFFSVNNTPSSTTGIHFKDDGSFGQGTNVLSARINPVKAGGIYSISNNGLTGELLGGPAWTFNDNTTGASGTVAQTSINAEGVTTVTATNTAVTLTNVYGHYFAGAPVASTNVTITNPYTIYVAGGKSRFNGTLQVADGTQIAGGIFGSDANGNGSWLAPGQVVYIAKTSNYTLTSTDYIVDCTSGSPTFTLPTAAGIQGKSYIIKVSGGGTVTMATASSQTIDNSSPGTVTTILRVVSDGANWKSW